jgi:hypothetical protein
MSLAERIKNHFNPIRFTRLERVELAKGEFCPPDEQPGEPYPLGFFKALTRSGIDGDLGFYCPKCHLIVQCGLVPGGSVKHCNKIEHVPRATQNLETRQIGTFKNEAQHPDIFFIPVGTL